MPAMIASNRQILLVDASPDDADLFRRALQRVDFGNPFHVVQSGEEAIKYLRGEGQYADRARHPVPYLLLLAPNLPGKSGWDVLRWVRGRSELNRVIVIIFGGAGSL